ALMNELSHIFNRLDLDTEEVLKAAETKWNFLPFRPGLVGGHCIGVDPYYLTHKAEAEGYFPKVILSGRELNDQMAKSIAENVILNMNLKKIKVQILIMGVTFKENCPDIRNSKVFDLIDALKDFGIHVECYDPWIDESMIENKDYLIKENLDINTYDGVIIAVAHDQFKEQSIESIKSLCRPNHTIFDLKHIFDKEYSDFRL
ncbi:MAG: UDP binding domain-containing protein, partial [Gammaproteobacteria bacterium]